MWRRLQTATLLLILCSGSLEARFWRTTDEETKTEAVTFDATTLTTHTVAMITSTKQVEEGATTTTTSSVTMEEEGSTKTAAGAKVEEEEEDDNLSGVGEEIINVATGIHKFVEAWDATTTTWTVSAGLTEKTEKSDVTMKPGRFSGERVEEGSGGGEGEGGGFESDVTIRGGVSKLNGPPCLPAPSDWPVCRQPRLFSLPNFFNHTSVEEAGAVLQEWAWLTKAECHHSAELFLCLLLTPRCPSPVSHLPCRSFCHTLQDSCWAFLENGRLPVECDLLPERAHEPGRPVCMSVSNWKGNHGGLECILCDDTF